MDSPALLELANVLPSWSARLDAFSSKYLSAVKSSPSSSSSSFSSHPPSAKDATAAADIVAAAVEPPTILLGASPLRPIAPVVAAAANLGSQNDRKIFTKLESKPSTPRPKFSSINGPSIYYDGEAQAAFFDCWTTLNAKRGLVRKELMAVKRKKAMMLPAAAYGYGESSSEDEDSDKAPEETPEEKRAREIEEERQKLAEKKRQEHEKAIGGILEYVDGCLDKASKACENAAFLWLKGEACSGHITFISSRIKEAVARINKEIDMRKPVDDEGFGEDADEMEPVVEVRPAKRPPPDDVEPEANIGRRRAEERKKAALAAVASRRRAYV